MASAHELTRRDALAAVALMAAPTEAAVTATTTQIRDYLLRNSPWVDPARTVDTVKAGDPDRTVRKAAVCWYPSVSDIRAAIARGCDLLVTHEPTFWEHAAPEQQWRDRGPGREKSRLLRESGLVILRAHDTWDNWPEIGIRDSWARYLGLDKRAAEGSDKRWHAAYDIPETTLRDFAQRVADRVRPLGEESVQIIGDPRMKVRRPALGVGCVVPDQEMVEKGADALIMCYDGASYWSCRERLAEMGVGIITVEHGSSEIPGLRALRDHLAATFAGVEFIFLCEHPKTWTVMGRR